MKSKTLKVVKNQVVRNSSGPDFLSTTTANSVISLHKSMDYYQPTPLVSLDTLSSELGVKTILVKDESKRFNLKAFKCLGGIYALSNVICRQFDLDINKICFTDIKNSKYSEDIKKMVFITATDGNHGKGIAWTAGQLGCKSIILMPKGSSEARAKAIREASSNTEVKITDLSYDDTVRYAAELASQNKWFLVQDTSWEGYETIPKWIAQGYMTMAVEALNEVERMGLGVPTHVFLQAGVGCMAGSIVGYMKNRYKERMPIVSIVEPDNVACVYESAKANDGRVRSISGIQETIMAGLNCGEPCSITWPILRDNATYYFACPDFIAARGIRVLGNPKDGDAKIISGESGAVTLGLVSLLLEKPELFEIRNDMGINSESVILLFNTEGDTDPISYNKIAYDGYEASPEGNLEYIFSKL